MQIDTDGLSARIDDLIDHLEKLRETTMLRVLEAKASAGEVAIGVTSAAMRVCGGAAFSKHLYIERLFRDAHAGAVMAPTGDVLREFIGKSLLGIRSSETRRLRKRESVFCVMPLTWKRGGL